MLRERFVEHFHRRVLAYDRARAERDPLGAIRRIAIVTVLLHPFAALGFALAVLQRVVLVARARDLKLRVPRLTLVEVLAVVAIAGVIGLVTVGSAGQ